MESENNLLKMYQDVAEMKGMLVASLANQSSRLDNQEVRLQKIDGEVGSLTGDVATNKSAINGLGNAISEIKVTIDTNRAELKTNHDKDVAEMKASFSSEITQVKANQSGQLAKVMMVVTPIVAVLALFLNWSKTIGV